MHRAKKVEIRQVGNNCVISPTVIAIAVGDRVRIINYTGHQIFVQLAGMRRKYKIAPRFDKIVTVPRIRPGIYHYVAFCYELQVYCTPPWGPLPMLGMPIIIVPKRDE